MWRDPLWRDIVGVLLAGAGLVACTSAVSAAPVAEPTAPFVLDWQAGPFPQDRGAPIAESSPIVATLDDQGPSVVVGDRSGNLYALHLSNGSPVSGWPVNDRGAPIDSTPSVAAVGADGLDSVFVGEGNAHSPHSGGYQAFGPNGKSLWDAQVHEPPTDRHPVYGVQASLTVTDLQGQPGIFAGSLGQVSYALAAATGAVLQGWPYFSADSVFSTAAAADLYGNGQTELVMGGASTAGVARGQSYTNGGHLRILNSRGGQICRYNMTQEVDSSPAVGGFLTGGTTGIVIGTGSYYGGASASNAVDAFGTDCQLVWSESLDAFTESSPALADVVGNGSLDIVQGTDNGATGEVWVLNGANGGVIWHQVLSGRVIGGSVTADLSGEGYQDVLVPTSHGVYVLDGRDGAVITVLAPDMGFQNSPLLTDDPDGTVGLTIAGYNGGNEGVVFHYEIPGSDGAEAVGAGSWPMFHHDPQLSGTTSGLPAAGSIPACDVPSAANLGYDLASRDGAVFSVGEPYCGSVDSATLGAPVVGTAMSPSVGGYWLATANGDVVGLGSAPTFGSLAGRHLASPVVGMAAAPDGRGYWLVSADGGVFGFGDARYWGAEAGHALSAPVVGIAPSPDGGGYWLASADGEVFGFGDAHVLGSMSGQHLAAPIVGITTDVATGGYWLLGADGGVFNFKAAFKGSMGDRRLAQPVVGLVATADGGGYWLLAADGGAFAFGDAPFIGSAAGRNNGGPIASGTGYCG